MVEVVDRYAGEIYPVASTLTCVRLSTPERRAAALMEEIQQGERERDFRKRYATPEWGGDA